MEAHTQRTSVVICAYTEERWRDLVAALASIKRQTLPPVEIIVAVDHNPQLLRRVAREIDGVTVVENRESVGLSGARNSGIAAAGGDVIAFMDEDAEASPDWLELLSSAYEDPLALGVGGAVEPSWDGGRPRWFPREFDWVVGCTYLGLPTSRSRVRNLVGCNMSLRREVFAAVGGFLSGLGRIGTYPAGCEETELCIRATQRFPDQYILYEPRARVSHHVPTKRATWDYYRRRCYAEGISKAAVARLTGAKDGLDSERAHALRTLPAGIVRGFGDAILGHDLYGLARAGAIAAGLAVTTAGYAAGVARQRIADRRQPESGCQSSPSQPCPGKERV